MEFTIKLDQEETFNFYLQNASPIRCRTCDGELFGPYDIARPDGISINKFLMRCALHECR